MDRVFVARERQLHQLQAYLGQVVGGAGMVCFVTGEAGSGKTALVTEFARRAQARYDDLVVAIGDCNAHTGIGDPYLPFREILGQLAGDVDAKLAQGATTVENANRLRGFLRVSGQAIVDLGPDLIDVFVPGAALAAKAGSFLAGRVGWLERLEALQARKSAKVGNGDLDLRLEQAHIFEQYTNVLQALATHRPLLLVVDDLQWADSGSISLLFHLARRITSTDEVLASSKGSARGGDSRILLLGTYRPADVALGRPAPSTGVDQRPRHPLEPVLNELKRYHGDIWVELSDASEAEGRQFVDALLDTEPNRLGEDFRRALHQHTDGHPLFTVELLHAMQQRGDLLQDAEGRWVEGPSLNWSALPARVEGVIEERIGRLADELRDLLRVATVEGDEFTAQVVARVRKIDERGVIEHLSGELERQHRLISAEGLEWVGGHRLSRYRFQHQLFHQYLYNGLDEIERAYLHEDVGTVLEALYGDRVADIAIQLARHFEEAAAWDKVLTYARQAGEQAQAAHAPSTAINQFTRALRAAREMSVAPPASLYRARGRAYETVGEHDRARADYEAALEMARTAADRRGEWQGLLDLGFLWVAWNYERAGQYFRAALELARTLDDSAALAHSLNRMGNWLVNVEQPAEALHYHREALAVFEALNDRPGLSETLDLLAMASLIDGDWAQSAAYYKQAIPLFRELDNRQGLVSALASDAERGITYWPCVMAGGVTTAAETMRAAEEAVKIAREIGWRSGEAYALIILGLCQASHGAYGAAFETLPRGLEIAQEIEHGQWMCFGNAALGMFYGDILACEKAQTHGERAFTIAQEIRSLNFTRAGAGWLASVCIQQGDLDRAEAVLGIALNGREIGQVDPHLTFGQRFCWCARAELDLARGQPASALHVIDGLIASLPNAADYHADNMPHVSQLRGRILAASGQSDEAERDLLAAQRGAILQSALPLEWRSHAALGRLYAATGQDAKAEDEWIAARRIIEKLAATIPDAALRENFRAAAVTM